MTCSIPRLWNDRPVNARRREPAMRPHVSKDACIRTGQARRGRSAGTTVDLLWVVVGQGTLLIFLNDKRVEAMTISRPHAKVSNTSVLIAGGGPTGLALAIVLRRYNID